MTRTRHRAPATRSDTRPLLWSLVLGAVLMLGACAANTPLPDFPASTVDQTAGRAAPSSPAAAALEQLRVAQADTLVSCASGVTDRPAGCYSRAVFMPKGWADPDGNGCDARRDVLARQAVADVVRMGKAGCVFTATVHDPYSNTDLPSTRAQVDHVVALGNAWVSGADHQTAGQRAALANDPRNLIAVTAALNESKGDKAADRWLPPAPGGFRCGYVAAQVSVKTIYRLTVTTPERDAMRRVLAGCPGQVLP